MKNGSGSYLSLILILVSCMHLMISSLLPDAVDAAENPAPPATPAVRVNGDYLTHHAFEEQQQQQQQQNQEHRTTGHGITKSAHQQQHQHHGSNKNNGSTVKKRSVKDDDQAVSQVSRGERKEDACMPSDPNQ